MTSCWFLCFNLLVKCHLCPSSLKVFVHNKSVRASKQDHIYHQSGSSVRLILAFFLLTSVFSFFLWPSKLSGHYKTPTYCYWKPNFKPIIWFRYSVWIFLTCFYEKTCINSFFAAGYLKVVLFYPVLVDPSHRVTEVALQQRTLPTFTVEVIWLVIIVTLFY